jgi:hypothetical protein
MSSKLLEQIRKSRLPSIVLIGNGPSATDVELGELIDGFEEVVRFNSYPRGDEYAAMVGTRMTTWVLNEAQPGDLRPSIGVSFIRILSEGYTNRFHADAKLARTHPDIDNPSSGVIMAANFLRNGIKVYTVGMDGYDGAERHYWSADTGGQQDSDREHDVAQENLFWDSNRLTMIPLREVM